MLKLRGKNILDPSASDFEQRFHSQYLASCLQFIYGFFSWKESIVIITIVYNDNILKEKKNFIQKCRKKMSLHLFLNFQGFNKIWCEHNDINADKVCDNFCISFANSSEDHREACTEPEEEELQNVHVLLNHDCEYIILCFVWKGSVRGYGSPHVLLLDQMTIPLQNQIALDKLMIL